MPTQKEIETQLEQLALLLEPLATKGGKFIDKVRSQTSALSFDSFTFKKLKKQLELKYLQYQLSEVNTKIYNYKQNESNKESDLKKMKD